MLDVKRRSESSSDRAVFELKGDINESVDLKELLRFDSKGLDLYCSGVRSINSVGVRSWVLFFNSARKQGKEIRFMEFSPALTLQAAQINNFALKSELVSIEVPFLCSKCENEEEVLFEVENGKELKTWLESQKCSKCGQKTDFDEIQEEYFNFL